MKLTRVIFDTDLRCGFEGLRIIAKDTGARLNADNTVLFMNRAHTAFKLIKGNSYLVYYKNDGKKIPLDSLRYLPTTFGGTELEVNEAIKKNLLTQLRYKSWWPEANQ